MTAFEDEIGGLMEDIKRYSMGDARIEFCLDEMLKRIRAEVDALAFDAQVLDGYAQPTRPDPGLSEAWLTGKSDVKNPTEAEHERIRAQEHDRTVRWVGRDY